MEGKHDGEWARVVWLAGQQVLRIVKPSRSKVVSRVQQAEWLEISTCEAGSDAWSEAVSRVVSRARVGGDANS